ncbi:MAG: DUF4402 domain-containing protein [Thermoanaerobaculia bacterium]
MRSGTGIPALWRISRRSAAAVVALLALVAAGRADAQGSASFTSTASAVIAGTLRITNTAPLHFGDVLPSAAPGTVAVNLTTAVAPTVTRTATPGASLSGTVFSAATFYVERTGTGNPHVYVTLPSAPVTIVRSGGGASMTVDTFRSNLNASCDGTSPGACPTAPFTLWVGGRLNVGGNQAPGVYSGTFAVTAHQF